MPKWIHRLSNKDITNKTADCASCGHVKIVKYGKGKWKCHERILADKRHYYLRSVPPSKPSHCEACGGTNKISYDHDHITGLHRGWLCHNCNTALGLLKDNPETLRNLIEYLK